MDEFWAIVLLGGVNGEEGVFDVSPYLEKGLFSRLKDRIVFNSARPFPGSVQWENGLDLCPDMLY